MVNQLAFPQHGSATPTGIFSFDDFGVDVNSVADEARPQELPLANRHERFRLHQRRVVAESRYPRDTKQSVREWFAVWCLTREFVIDMERVVVPRHARKHDDIGFGYRSRATRPRIANRDIFKKQRFVHDAMKFF